MPKKHFTRTYQLHPNILLGSLQLLGWLFFQPGNWRHFLTRIDPHLPPDFCLAELNKEQWRNRDLWRLLATLHLALPLLFSLIPLFSLLAMGKLRAAFFVGLGLGVFLGISVSIALGAGVGAMMGLSISLGLSLMLGTREAFSIDLLIGYAPGVIFGAAAGLSGYAAAALHEQKQRRLTRLMGGVMVGLLVSLLVAGSVAGLMGLIVIVWENGPAGRILNDLLYFGVYLLFSGVAVSWQSGSWRRGAAWGVVLSVAFGRLMSLTLGEIAFSHQVGGVPLLIILLTQSSAMFTFLYIIPFVIAYRVAGSWAGAVAGGAASAGVHPLVWYLFNLYALQANLAIHLSALLLGLSLFWWRPLLTYPFQTLWNQLLFRLDQKRLAHQPGLLPRHSVFWDDLQWLRCGMLHQHLLLTAINAPPTGAAAIEYVFNTRQRAAARSTQIELDMRHLAQCAAMDEIGRLHRYLGIGELGGSAASLLRSFRRLSQDVEAALHYEGLASRRIALQEVGSGLEQLADELAKSDGQHAARLRSIARQWQEIVHREMDSVDAQIEEAQIIQTPYIIGIPLSEQEALFVGRRAIARQITERVTAHPHAPVLLYGQRRMGKTSLLKNLSLLLPSQIVPLFVDLQGPPAQSDDLTGFVYSLARSLALAAGQYSALQVSPLSYLAFKSEPIPTFIDWLKSLRHDSALGQNAIYLLAVDEFDVLQAGVSEGRFQASTIVHLIKRLAQLAPRFQLLLSSSHTLEELQAWLPNLDDLQSLHLNYLNEDEIERLIVEPLQTSAFHYQSEAIERIAALTRGHPFLVQLLCAELLNLKNRQPLPQRSTADQADVEAAVPYALQQGHFFFTHIEKNQLTDDARKVLYFLAAQGEKGTVAHTAPDSLKLDKLSQTLTLLRRRELIEEVEGGYRFQVALIRRWFAGEVR